MEFTNQKNLTQIEPLKKTSSSFSSTDILKHGKSDISYYIFLPFYFILLLIQSIFEITIDTKELKIITKREQKEREKIIQEQELKRKEREDFIKLQEQERKTHENNSKKFESEIVKLVREHNIIIDSNLWMDYEFDSFFSGLIYILNKYNIILNLCGSQFDEICNIRRKYSWNAEKCRKANYAIKRIEKYQVKKHLKINSITYCEDEKAHADPLILEYLISEYPKNGGIALITNDKSFRVRARQIFEDNGCSNYRVFDGNGLNNLAESFCLINNIERLF